MTPGAYCDGIQHVGIPTDHLENTIHFYEDLGFQVILRACVPEKNQHVAFLQLGNLVIETYEDPVALCDGAINHIALNCLDIEKAYEALDFWERGVYFFIIQGPNKERIEFCQKL